MKIGFVGLSHLGIVTLAALASKGHNIVGIDLRPDRVQGLSVGELPLFEPGLSELWSQIRPRLKFSTDQRLLADCEIVYVALDVPTDDRGLSDLTPVASALRTALSAAKPSATVVLLSQVNPGFSREFISRFREQQTAALPIFHYQVETLIFGRALERALQPERYIVGCENPLTPLPSNYRQLLQQFNCPILPMRFESAELAKVSINAYLVSSVVLSNVLAELAAKIGADWSEVEGALRLDARIGQAAYLKPGLGIAGGNLERDLATISSLGNSFGSDTGLLRSWQTALDYYKDWVLRQLSSYVYSQMSDARVAVWGLAYKKDTDSIKNSPSVDLLGRLRRNSFCAYDPQVKAAGLENVAIADTPLAACRNCDALVIMTPWDEFKGVDLRAVAVALKGKVVIDPFRVLKSDQIAAAGLRQLSLGVG